MNTTLRMLTWVCMVLAVAGIQAWSQVTNGSLTSSPPINTSGPFPVGTEAIWLTLVAPATATITWLIGKIPPLPKQVLPWLTPFLGIGIGWLFKYATDSHWPWWNSAGAGAIATTLYEGIKGLSGAGPTSALTPTPQTRKPPTTP